MKPLDECMYYIVRADGGLGPPEKDVYFEDALEHIRKLGPDVLRRLELRALVHAAMRRDRTVDFLRAANAKLLAGRRVSEWLG
jgi:hypothetical protein